jgi:ribosomal protein S8
MKQIFSQSLSLFKKGFLQKNNFIICPSNQFTINFFIKLQKLGYLANIYLFFNKQIPNNKYIKIYYKYNNFNAYSFKDIIIFSTTTRYYYKTYIQILFLKKQLNSGSLIFSTSFGILTDFEILEKKIGGFLICYIF